MKKTLIIFTLFVLLFALGCSRYDNGPLISFRTAKSRIIGLWEVEKYMVNESDSTETYHSLIGCEIEFTELDNLIYHDPIYQDGYVLKYKNCKNNGFYLSSWKFHNLLKYELYMGTLPDSLCSSKTPLCVYSSEYWEILRLTDNEMHLCKTDPKFFIGNPPEETTYYLELKKL
jgi:hypothetical protein